MSVKYDLHMTIEQTGEEVSLSGEVSDDQEKLLKDFVQFAEDVWNTDFVKTGNMGELNIKWDRESGTQITALLPDWNHVMVFLHKFRPLLLNNEKTNFYRVLNILAKELDHPYFQKTLGLQHELYSGKVCQSEFQFKSNEVLINSEKVLFDWLNSHEYHRDEDKKKFILSLHQVFPLDGSRVIFLRLLMQKAIATINVANFILLVLGKKKELTVTMRPPEDAKK